MNVLDFAMKMEKDGKVYYEKLAEQCREPGLSMIFSRLAEDEQKHFTVIENIYHFINAPNQYQAWAEFSNLDEFRQFGRDVDV